MNCSQYYTQNLALMPYNEFHYAEGRLEKEDINALKNYEQYYKAAISFSTATLAGKTAASRLHSFPCCLFSALRSNFNPRLIINKPAVKNYHPP